jgi:hypothetical protein
MIEEARVLGITFPIAGVDLQRPQRLQPRPLGLQPAAEPLPCAEQRLMRNFDGATVRLALPNNQPPAVEAFEHVLLHLVEIRPAGDMAQGDRDELYGVEYHDMFLSWDVPWAQRALG